MTVRIKDRTGLKAGNGTKERKEKEQGRWERKKKRGIMKLREMVITVNRSHAACLASLTSRAIMKNQDLQQV